MNKTTGRQPILRSIPIQKSLFTGIVILVSVLSLGIFAATYVNTQQIKKRMSRSIINHSIDEITASIDSFFKPVDTQLSTLRDWARENVLQIENGEFNNRLLTPILQNNPQISSVLVADNHGAEHTLLRMPDHWLNRQTRRELWGGRSRIVQLNHDGSTEIRWQALGYDPRQRPWFQGAMAAKDNTLFWTKPYVFFTTKEPGMTAAIRVPVQDRQLVLGLDVLLSDITRVSSGMRVSSHGKVFILTDDRRVIGLPRGIDATAAKNLLLKPPERLGIALIADATRAYDALPAGYQGPFQFESQGEKWWGGGKAYPLTEQRTLWIAAVLPEFDLLAGIDDLQKWFGAIISLVLVFSMLAAAALSHRYGKPIRQLLRQSKRIRLGEFDVAEDIHSPIREINELAQAQERMRKGLQSLFRLERDIQLARQIQLKTFPEQLPQLARFDIAAWSLPAEETAGDSYDIIGCRAQPSGHQTISEDEPENLVVMLADATGHGIGPALSVTQVRAMLRMGIRLGCDLENMLGLMNDQLLQDLHGGRFITLWMAIINGNNGTITNYSAGQAPLLHYESANGVWHEIKAQAPPLGVVDNWQLQHSHVIDMHAGDILAVFSDGVFDRNNTRGDRFGLQRVQHCMAQNTTRDADAMSAYLRQALNDFADACPAKDDQTGLIIKCLS